MHNHSHAHGHSHHDHDHHSHNHGHHGGAGSGAQGRAFVIGIVLNSLFVLAEILFGLHAHSMALLADAGHNAGDALSLFMAWGAVWLSGLKPTARFTYGLRGSSILAALANALILMIVTGGIAWEALIRLFHPEPVAGGIVMAVATAGIAVNGISAWLFAGKGDLNVRAAFAHMLADAVVSAGVVFSGLIIVATGWGWIDPIVSLIVSALIVYGTWGLLTESLGLALQGVPPQIDPGAVRSWLCQAAGVDDVHDLHIWGMSTSDVALSAHLLMKGGHPGDAFLRELAHGLEDHFHIGHSTLQIEISGDADCPLAPDHVV